ncbi:MAG: hypothetical protein V4672_00855 [Verrucomicrobiota bacterium]
MSEQTALSGTFTDAATRAEFLGCFPNFHQAFLLPPSFLSSVLDFVSSKNRQIKAPLLAMPDLSQLPMIIAVLGLAYFAIVAVHECGHYCAGLVIGVPHRKMRIRLFTFPQHVALRDGDEWGSPTTQIERYIKLSEPLMPTTGKVLLFLAGGFILETAALLLWVALKWPFYREICTLVVWMTLIYLVFDVSIYLKTRRGAMDFSAMYSVSPVLGSLLGLSILGLQFYAVTLL